MLEILIILATLVADQATKVWAAATLPVFGGSLPLIEGVFHFTYTQNYGAAFGLMQNQRTLFLILTPLAAAALIYVMIRYRKTNSTALRVALSLFLSGALGNFIDRVALGYVRDLFDFRLINFPVFNVADSCVVIGAALMILDVILIERKRIGTLRGQDDDAAVIGGADGPTAIFVASKEPHAEHDDEPQDEPPTDKPKNEDDEPSK